MRSNPSAGLVLILLLTATASRAQTIDITWNNCVALPNAAVDKTYACDESAAGVPFHGVMSFIAPQAFPQFVGIGATIDLLTSEPILPDFWRLGVGECREGAFTFPASLSGIGTGTTGACQNPWRGGNTGGGYQYTSQYLATYRARIRCVFARDTPIALASLQRYIAGVFDLDPDANDGTCSGCGFPACLFFNSLEIYQQTGAPGGDVSVLSQGGESQFLTWQGGVAGHTTCYVPARNRTWGSVKALYR